MILVNIDSLSVAELRYLAQCEGVEDFDSKDSEELLDELGDILDISDGVFHLHNNGFSTSGQRYINALSDFPGHEVVEGLPGVEPLATIYMETSIHLMLRDLNWAFAYWTISPLTANKLNNEDSSYLENVFLRVTSTDNKTGLNSIYDIDLKKDDTKWNINLPEFGQSYQVALCVKSNSGLLIALAQSMAVNVPIPYWTTNSEELEEDSVLFNALFSSIVSKEGMYRDNVVIPQVVSNLISREKN
ncbi:MAG: DUF4912 domain-containing protein [Spirochaetaceae bacterium]|nr:DUF4912 domain-containing protein [Spirochaetaceae bacterium]